MKRVISIICVVSWLLALASSAVAGELERKLINAAPAPQLMVIHLMLTTKI